VKLPPPSLDLVNLLRESVTVNIVLLDIAPCAS